MKKHLASGIKVYDPYIKEKILENQFLDFKEFTENVDFIIIMVGHKQIIEQLDIIRNKIILDTRNVIEIEGVYRL